MPWSRLAPGGPQGLSIPTVQQSTTTTAQWGPMAGTRALGGTEKKPSWKAWRRAQVKELGRKTLKKLGQLYGRQSLVPNLPVIPNEHFPFVVEVEKNWLDIRAELEVLLKDRERIPFMEEMSPDQARISPPQRWRAFFL